MFSRGATLVVFATRIRTGKNRLTCCNGQSRQYPTQSWCFYAQPGCSGRISEGRFLTWRSRRARTIPDSLWHHIWSTVLIYDSLCLLHYKCLLPLFATHSSFFHCLRLFFRNTYNNLHLKSGRSSVIFIDQGCFKILSKAAKYSFVSFSLSSALRFSESAHCCLNCSSCSSIASSAAASSSRS